jgi:general nucleoside transport system ATP-binding protein
MGSERQERQQHPLVEMKSITKRFPGALANEGVNFTCHAGEIHALLGENGAGKSTLMKILAGLYRPDSGDILVRGKPVSISSPREAIRLGIGMVHQELRLVKSISVAENIVMGSEDLNFFYSYAKQEKNVRKFSLGIGLEVAPKTPVWQLSVGEQQRVEILKVLYRGVKVLVLDEPTALLTPQETHKLFEYLRTIASMGHGIAFVTHKLEEVMDVADRITVLRQGSAIATLKKQETNVQDLARLMIGRIPESDSPGTESSAGNTILEVKNLYAMGDSKRPALNGLSLSLSAGEILGIAGVAGNGQRELAETLVGLRRVSGGHILFEGDPIAHLSPRQILRLGMGYIPEDRLGVGGVASLPLSENFILRDYTRHEFSGKFFLKPKWIDRNAAELIKTYNIKTPDANTPLAMLSGGNIQKVILAREISRNPKLLVAMNPTRGLDIGATETIHRTFLNQKRVGKAILLISEDLDELFGLSDRIAVIYKGKIRGVVKADRSLVEDIGLMMGGASA